MFLSQGQITKLKHEKDSIYRECNITVAVIVIDSRRFEITTLFLLLLYDERFYCNTEETTLQTQHLVVEIRG